MSSLNFLSSVKLSLGMYGLRSSKSLLTISTGGILSLLSSVIRPTPTLKLVGLEVS